MKCMFSITILCKWSGLSPLSECSQSKPISLASIIMRIFERLVYKQEIFATLQSSIGPNQFAYKEGQYHNGLLKCQHWLNWLDKGADFVKVYCYDFSKAFDFVSYQIVCNKLKSYNVDPYILNWTIYFLSGHKRRVVVDGFYHKIHWNWQRRSTSVLEPEYSQLWLMISMLYTQIQTCLLSL